LHFSEGAVTITEGREGEAIGEMTFGIVVEFINIMELDVDDDDDDDDEDDEEEDVEEEEESSRTNTGEVTLVFCDDSPEPGGGEEGEDVEEGTAVFFDDSPEPGGGTAVFCDDSPEQMLAADRAISRILPTAEEGG
jgi:hypothetical protein